MDADYYWRIGNVRNSSLLYALVLSMVSKDVMLATLVDSLLVLLGFSAACC